MNAVLTMYRSTIGKKVIMGVTGAVMVGWLLAHMAGNLQVFLGIEAFDHYAELIQSQKELLYLMRAGMLTCLVLHIVTIVQLALAGRAARPAGYAGGRKNHSSTLAAQYMRWGGLVLLLFLIWHLADLTIGVPAVNPAFVHGKAYGNLIGSLSRPPVAALYILANLALGMHIYHRVYSGFQPLGTRPHDGQHRLRQRRPG